jgi:phosphatidylglycerophosphatase A
MMRPARLGLPCWHPAALAATGLGLGLLPWAPGTWAALAALPCAWAIRSVGGPISLAAASVIAFAFGCWAADRVAQASDQHDPGFIVIDEIAAQWLALLVVPLDWHWYAAAFLLFRLFDITKPWPIRAIERRVAGGLGVMLDDVAAALYAVPILLIGEGVLGIRP